MTNIPIQKIIKQINDHERRLRILESAYKGPDSGIIFKGKAPTLPEIIKGKSFKSGQEKVAIIVGYYEKMLEHESIKDQNVKEGWKIGKFDGKYSPSFLARAIKDGLVRNIDGSLDLSQTGEKFWNSFVKQDVGRN
jgi:hypothetical protein